MNRFLTQEELTETFKHLKKYIRTKDTIFELETIYSNPYEEKTYCVSKNGERYVIEDIVSTANTLIELYDGVLIEEKNNPSKWFIMEVEEFKVTPLDKLMIKIFNFKAFIKTNKGLIYVAKMNSEGVLELIYESNT